MKEFDRIIGYDEIKRELIKICDTMRNPDKYEKIGVRTPKGLLLHGEPGVGKSLMCECLINASGREAFTCRRDEDQSSFVSKIRETFKQAKENAPSIVLLDDMDKFANDDDKHKDSAEYVAVQACIDSVKKDEVFVLATCNGLDKLPESLLRVGRFDQTIEVSNPFGEDAEKIIAHYLKNKNCAEDVNPKIVARILNGDSCAALETVVNEAGIYAAFANKEKIEMQDVVAAALKIIYKVPESMKKLNHEVLRSTAIHEAGHALVTEILEPGSVSIVSIRQNTGDVGGITAYARDNDLYLCSYKMMQDRLMSALAGRAATEICLGVVDTGARSDLDTAFLLGRRFITHFASNGFYFFLDHYGSQEKDDEAMKRVADLIQNCYLKVKEIVAKNREFLDKLVDALLEKETLLTDDIQAIKQTCTIVNC